MWRLPWTSGYSYPRVTMIRIDIYPAGENPIHMICTLSTPVHVRHTYVFYGQSTYMLTFRKPSSALDGPYCTREKRASDTTPSPAEWSTGPPPSFSPNTVIEAVIKSKHLLTNKLYQFTGPILPACDRYVQYLLTRANPSVHNWHRWGWQPGRGGLAKTTPRPS
jgi:hypothetical protein